MSFRGSTEHVSGGGLDVSDWALEDSHGRTIEDVIEIREEIERLVAELFDETERKEAGENGSEDSATS